MNLRRHATILAISAIGAATFLGTEVANAEPASSSLDSAITYVTFDTSDARFTSEGGTYLCDPVGHPYLVLDAVPDNSSRVLRRATYNTGDSKPLNVFEHVAPVSSGNGDFREVHILVNVIDAMFASGHGSVTVQCASTPESAHQK